MITLALELSHTQGSLALFNGNIFLAQELLNSEAPRGASLFATLEQLLADAKIVLSDLSLIVAGAGPGSYTGMRIAVTAAKTLAMTLECAVVRINSMDAIAMNCNTPSVAVVLNAFSGKAYYRNYRMDGAWPCPLEDTQTCAYHQLATQMRKGFPVIVEPGLETHIGTATISSTDIVPRAEHVGRLGIRKFQTNGGDDLHTLAPFYIRPSAAEEQWTAREAAQPSLKPKAG